MSKNHFYILIFFSMLAWGMSWTNMKILYEYIGTKELVFLRYFVSAVASFFIVLALRLDFKISKRTLFVSFVAGFITSIYTALIFIGTSLGTASVAGSFINTLSPIVTFVLLVLFFKKKMFKVDVFALFLGFIGSMLILGIWKFDTEKILTIYNLYFVLGAFLWSVLTILSSFSNAKSPVIFTFYMYLFVAILSFPFSDITSFDFSKTDFRFWANLLCVSVVSTSLATSFFFLGAKQLGSSEVSSFMFLVPFSSIFCGAIFLGESVSIWMIFGVLLNIFAIYIINRMGYFKGK
ncbi:MAG: DMT family transporter [Campylobacteraceae bacterium]